MWADRSARQRITLCVLVAGICLAYLIIAAVPGIATSADLTWTTTCRADCTTYSHVAASTSPAALVVSFAVCALLVFWRSPQPTPRIDAPASVLRLVIAFLIDSTALLAAMVPAVALYFLTLEALQTGHFVWAFARTDLHAMDALVLVLMPIYFGLLYAYFRGPQLTGRSTLGQHVMAFSVTPFPRETSTPPPTLLQKWLSLFLLLYASPDVARTFLKQIWGDAAIRLRIVHAA